VKDSRTANVFLRGKKGVFCHEPLPKEKRKLEKRKKQLKK